MEDQHHSHIHMHMDVSHTLSRSLPFASRFSPCLSLRLFLPLASRTSLSLLRERHKQLFCTLAGEAREERALL